MGQERSKDGTSGWGTSSSSLRTAGRGAFSTCCGVNLAVCLLGVAGVSVPEVSVPEVSVPEVVGQQDGRKEARLELARATFLSVSEGSAYRGALTEQIDA